MGARSSLWVVLHRESPTIVESDAFYHVVVRANVGDVGRSEGGVEAGCQLFGAEFFRRVINMWRKQGESVVLGGDGDAPRGDVDNGDVNSAVTKFEFVGT